MTSNRVSLLSAQALHLRPARDRPPPDAARLPAGDHARPERCGAIELHAHSGRCLCTALTQTRARSSLGGQPVNHLVLSGTESVVPSGTRSSCYRGPKSQLTSWRSISFRLRNFTNLESFGFLLTERLGWRPVDNRLPAQSRLSDRRRVVSASRTGSAASPNHSQQYRRTA